MKICAGSGLFLGLRVTIPIFKLAQMDAAKKPDPAQNLVKDWYSFRIKWTRFLRGDSKGSSPSCKININFLAWRLCPCRWGIDTILGNKTIKFNEIGICKHSTILFHTIFFISSRKQGKSEHHIFLIFSVKYKKSFWNKFAISILLILKY